MNLACTVDVYCALVMKIVKKKPPSVSINNHRPLRLPCRILAVRTVSSPCVRRESSCLRCLSCDMAQVSPTLLAAVVHRPPGLGPKHRAL